MEERIYRNIWKEIGISDAQVEERLSQLISTFFYDEKERLYFPVGDDRSLCCSSEIRATDSSRC